MQSQKSCFLLLSQSCYKTHVSPRVAMFTLLQDASKNFVQQYFVLKIRGLEVRKVFLGDRRFLAGFSNILGFNYYQEKQPVKFQEAKITMNANKAMVCGKNQLRGNREILILTFLFGSNETSLWILAARLQHKSIFQPIGAQDTLLWVSNLVLFLPCSDFAKQRTLYQQSNAY